MSTRKAVGAVALLGVLVSAACARNAKKGEELFDQETSVHVMNNNWLEATVYAVRSGTRLRLGTVGTGRSAEFMLPSGFTAGSMIHLVADPIGSRSTFRSEAIAVAPGGQVQLVIENNIRMSSVSVR